MALRTQDRNWVSVKVGTNSVVFDHGSLDELSGTSSEDEGTVNALRIIQRATALNTAVMDRLVVTANRLLTGPSLRTHNFLKEAWQSHLTPSLFYVYEPNHRITPIAEPDQVLNWLQPFYASHLHQEDPVVTSLIEVMRSPAKALDDLWPQLQQSFIREIRNRYPPMKAAYENGEVSIEVVDPAEARRHALLMLGWPTSAVVGGRAGSKSANPGQWAKDKRDALALLGCWSTNERTFVHPSFQFEVDGTLRSDVKRLLTAMAMNPKWTPAKDKNGWRRAYWLYQPFRSLSERAVAMAKEYAKGDGHGTALNDTPDGAAAYLDHLVSAAPSRGTARTPADVFPTDPEIVIALASAEAAKAGPASAGEAEGVQDDV